MASQEDFLLRPVSSSSPSAVSSATDARPGNVLSLGKILLLLIEQDAKPKKQNTGDSIEFEQ